MASEVPGQIRTISAAPAAELKRLAGCGRDVDARVRAGGGLSDEADEPLELANMTGAIWINSAIQDRRDADF